MSFSSPARIKKMLRIRKIILPSLAICATQLFCTPAHAQRDSRSATRDEVPAYRESRSSELENENLKHAAASAAQIEDVLRKDAGLLVEVKRWAAKEAADNGQVVEDADLSDQGHVISGWTRTAGYSQPKCCGGGRQHQTKRPRSLRIRRRSPTSRGSL